MLGHDEIRERLRTSYNAFATEREGLRKQVWKLTEREDFAQRMRDGEGHQAAGDRRGNGPGQRLLPGAGLRRRGDRPLRGDGGLLPRQGNRRAGHGHAPPRLRARGVRRCLRDELAAARPQRRAGTGARRHPRGPAPGRPVLRGPVGRHEFEGIAEWDHQQPQRFFCFRTDEELRRQRRGRSSRSSISTRSKTGI